MAAAFGEQTIQYLSLSFYFAGYVENFWNQTGIKKYIKKLENECIGRSRISIYRCLIVTCGLSPSQTPWRVMILSVPLLMISDLWLQSNGGGGGKLRVIDRLEGLTSFHWLIVAIETQVDDLEVMRFQHLLFLLFFPPNLLKKFS